MTELFNLQSASVTFGSVHALMDCALRIQAGERVALIASNGSGKSAMLRLLRGLLKPSMGILSADLLAPQAMLFQRPYMLRASMLHNIVLGLRFRGTPWAAAKVHAVAALERVSLADLATHNAKALSISQQQRVALARAWALQPQVLLLE